jgi:hypothetical protein
VLLCRACYGGKALALCWNLQREALALELRGPVLALIWLVGRF